MSKLQQVVFEVEMDYAGHPYYVTGNAILHEMADDLDYDAQRKLRVSHGVFAPGQFGQYPRAHSNAGTRPGMGSSLPEVTAYDDLFLTRHPEQRWLLDSRPRDALNVPRLKVQGGKPVQGRQVAIGQRTTWYIHAMISATDDGLLPLADDLLDGLQFGGSRNYGYGLTRLKDTQVVDLDALDYSRLRDADEYLIELVTPYVLESAHPHTDDHDIPWWWAGYDDLRTREEQLVEQREQYTLRTVDHGQVVQYAGDRPVETAKNGLTGVGPHSKYGFGELRIKPKDTS